MASIITQKGSSSSSFSSSTPQWKYDVFLSFRGEDTRKSFMDHLYESLKQKGITTFRDKENLERGKAISSELLKAIEQSRFAIVILSSNYASSTWCLDELAKIIECKKEIGTTVLPIFYEVDPSNVWKQTGSFAHSFAAHEENFKNHKEKVETWRATLNEVANLKGWHLQDGSESKFIKNIVRELCCKLSYVFFEDTKDLVGIESRVKELESYLVIEFNDVRIIGVWGKGGIGKTTLARVFSHMISEKFEGFCFLANVREVCEKGGLVMLQQELIRQILNVSMSILDADEGVVIIKNRLHHKRILLVLDDVNQLDQLKKLAGKRTWFGPGSTVIITTRDKDLLQILEVDEIYDAQGLNDDEALHLLCLKAFKIDHPPKDYLELSKDVVKYAKGLPLAIEILGSFLFNRSINQWNSTLNRLKEFPERAILEVLKISYDGLQEVEKKIFLYIACFFNHEGRNSVVEKLGYLGLYPGFGLGVLVDKSLIKVNEIRVWMHDLLQEMGREIIYEECPKEPGKRSCLWSFEDINNVLTKNTGTKAIQGIVLKLHESKEAHWNAESFSKMHHLKLLEINNVHLLHDPKHFPNGLRFLEWSGYPSKSLPLNFQSNELIELCMCGSYIERLWEGAKSFERLKVIQLNKSSKLMETSDFTEVPNLEKLSTEDCINLLWLHPSIGVLKKLTLLNLKGCKNLTTLPNKFEMESLEILVLSGCSKLKEIPEFGTNMQRVMELYLDGTAITKLPTSIGHLIGLALLILRDCKSLMCLPNSICNLKLLKTINLSGCSKLERLPKKMGNIESVEELDVSGTAIKELPSFSGLLKNLRKTSPHGCKGLASSKKISCNEHRPYFIMPRSLDLMGFNNLWGLTKLILRDCNLQKIPNGIGSLFSLEVLALSGNNFVCLPESIIQLHNLRTMELENCMRLRSLPELPLCIVAICGYDCTSLETLPYLLKPDSLCEVELFLSNCSKLVDNQGVIDMFFAVIRKHLQGLYVDRRYDIIIPGSEIPKWFSYQSLGAEVNLQVPLHLCDKLMGKLMGIAICVVFCSLPHHQIDDKSSLSCQLIANGKEVSPAPGIETIVDSSNHIWLLYLASKFYQEGDIISLRECDENGFSQIGIRIETASGLEVKKCGFCMVYKEGTKDWKESSESDWGELVRGKDLIGQLGRLFATEKSEEQITLEPQTVFDVEAADMTIHSSEEAKFQIKEIWYDAVETQPEGIEMMVDVEAMQPQVTSTLKPQGVVFDVEAYKIPKSSRQMEFQIEDIEMEPEAIEQNGSEAYKIPKSCRQMEFQIEDIEMEPEAIEQNVSEAYKSPRSCRQMEFQIEDIEMEPEAIEQNGSEAEIVRGKDLIGQLGRLFAKEKSEEQITLEPQTVFDVEAADMTIHSSEEAIEQNGSEADQHKEAQRLLMQAGLGLIEPPKDEEWENTKEIYLMNNELSILPENPRCLKLSALFLQRNYKLRTIPHSFFDYMPALEILNLSRTGIRSLPDSLTKLVSLKRLFLNDCHYFMMLSPKVGELKQLEVLDLEGTEIMHLPEEIKKLTNLTCLEVSIFGYTSDCKRAMQSMAVVPYGVISALSQLEELNIDVNLDDERWDACVEAILTEICNLMRLNTLKFYFPRVKLLKYLQRNSPGGMYPSLSHFRFTVGHHVKRIMSRVPRDVEFELERWEKCLKFINGVDIPRDIKKALQHATSFFLDRHATVKSLSNFGIRNMEKLKCCVMGECNEVEVIIDEAQAYEEDDESNEISDDSYATEKIILGSLEYLYVYRMKSLRSIWIGQFQWKSLFLLKSLTFNKCPQLATIFMPSFLDKLCNLEELTVIDCPSIRSLVSSENTDEHKSSYFLPNLKRISLHYMPGLVSISGGLHIAPNLELSSFYNCPNLKNPFTEEVSSKDLKKIKGEKSWWEVLEWNNGGPGYLAEIFFPIDIWDC